MVFTFKELKQTVDSILADLAECQDSMKDKDFLSRAQELCKTAQHHVSQMLTELARCQREFDEVKELMQ